MVFYVFANIPLLIIFVCGNCLNFLRADDICGNSEDNTIDSSDKCYQNQSPETIIKNHGFQFQRHKIETADHYYLTLFRIQDEFPSDNETQSTKQPVFLHHGLGSNGMCFALMGHNSLVFYLAKRGYDVWLANHRGNRYSPGHRYLNMTNAKYWDFSFHEIAIFDVPASLDYILKQTGGERKIIYMGHSMGTTISFIYSSLRRNHAKKSLAAIISLAPAIFRRVQKSNPIGPYLDYLAPLAFSLKRSNVNVLIPKPALLSKYLKKLCGSNPQMTETFRIVVILMSGFDETKSINKETLQRTLAFNPDRTSTRNPLHYLQCHQNDNFQQYDFGSAENMKRYKSETPPEYPLSKIAVPVHLFYGSNDFLVSEEDVFWIYDKLTAPNKSITLVPKKETGIKYNHLDYLIDKNVETNFYVPLMKVFEEIKKY